MIKRNVIYFFYWKVFIKLWPSSNCRIFYLKSMISLSWEQLVITSIVGRCKPIAYFINILTWKQCVSFSVQCKHHRYLNHLKLLRSYNCVLIKSNHFLRNREEFLINYLQKLWTIVLGQKTIENTKQFVLK